MGYDGNTGINGRINPITMIFPCDTSTVLQHIHYNITYNITPINPLY